MGCLKSNEFTRHGVFVILCAKVLANPNCGFPVFSQANPAERGGLPWQCVELN